MPTPHPLAAVAQHMVRAGGAPARRPNVRSRPWWRRLFRLAGTPVALSDVPAVAEKQTLAYEAPPGLALPPTLVLPEQRPSS